MPDLRSAEFLTFETGEASPNPKHAMPWDDELEASPRVLPSVAPVPSNLPRRRRFVGRDEELAAVEQALVEGGGVAAIHGLAGAGKTALALEYAHRAADKRAYPGGVWWLAAEGAPAEALASLPPILRAAAPQPVKTALGTLAAGATSAEIAAVVRLALSLHKAPMLLVLDGVDAVGWRALLPSGDVRVLATTRDARLAMGARVALGSLSPSDARALAVSLAGAPADDREESALDRVVNDGLGAHAAAVEAAALAVKRWAHAWSEYERFMYAEPDAMLEERDLQGDYPESALGALDRSLDLCARGTVARRLLEGAAVFAPEEVPLEWAAKAAQLDAARVELRREIALLRGLGLLRFDDEARTASMHRLVHRRVRERAEPDDLREDSRRGASEVAGWLEATVDPTRTIEVEARRAHIEEALAAADRGKSDDDWITIADRLGAHLKHLGQYAEARSLLERAVERAAAIDPPAPALLAESLASLATMLKDLGQPGAAEPYLERALDLDEKLYGGEHPAVARDLSSLAAVKKDLGNLAEAKALLERALAIDESTSGPDHPDTAKTLATLAAVEKDLGHMSEARALLERALAIDEKAFGPDHPSAVVRLTNLAMVLKELGEAAEARPLLSRALVILEGTYGPDHPIVATSLTNLALVLKDLGQGAEAMPLLVRANRIVERALPPNHPTRAKIAAHLAHTSPPSSRPGTRPPAPVSSPGTLPPSPGSRPGTFGW
jgi:tetratricopeptide (TPR) repeat protein